MPIGGVKTTANPSDILTKFLPAPAHQEHSKYLNLNTPKPCTQNGDFIKANEQPNLTSAKRPGQSIMHKARQVQIHASGQIFHIGQESLSPISYTNKRLRQKQRQKLWTNIHNLRRQSPPTYYRTKTTTYLLPTSEVQSYDGATSVADTPSRTTDD